MKRQSKNNYFLSIAFVVSAMLPILAHAATVNLATVPLATATTTAPVAELTVIDPSVFAMLVTSPDPVAISLPFR